MLDRLPVHRAAAAQVDLAGGADAAEDVATAGDEDRVLEDLEADRATELLALQLILWRGPYLPGITPNNHRCELRAREIYRVNASRVLDFWYSHKAEDDEE